MHLNDDGRLTNMTSRFKGRAKKSKTSQEHALNSSDPLDQVVLAQLALESPEEREQRLEEESISKRIDGDIEQERKAGGSGLQGSQLGKQQQPKVQLLLFLGPSNAGKT